MKKIIIPFILLNCNMVFMFAQSCNTVLDKYNEYSHYVPSIYEGSAVKVVNLNFIIVQDDNGNYNFNENNPIDMSALDSILSYLNRRYRQLAYPSDPCPGIAFIPNAMIQFHANKIFVKSTVALNGFQLSNADGTAWSNSRNYLINNNFAPNWEKAINVFFFNSICSIASIENNLNQFFPYNGTNEEALDEIRSNLLNSAQCTNNATDGGNSNGVGSINYNGLSYISMRNHYYMHRFYQIINYPNGWNWRLEIAAKTLAHELGHSFGLPHTFDKDRYENPADPNLTDVPFDPNGDRNFCNPFQQNPPNYDPCNGDYDGCSNNMMSYSDYWEYLSPLQLGKAHRSFSLMSNYNKLYNCPYSHIPLQITTDEEWIFSCRMYQDIVVNSGVILTIRCKVMMPTNASILVRPGGKLIIDGGTLTSGCDGELWQGIRVLGNPNDKWQDHQYQGKVELKNGATIENAVCGILVGNKFVDFATATVIGSCSITLSEIISNTAIIELFNLPNLNHNSGGGGYVTATDAHFINNKESIRFNPYKRGPYGSDWQNISSFTRCNFIVNDNAYFRTNRGDRQVILYGVKDIDFYACDFRDEQSWSYRKGFGTGIYVGNDANVIVGWDAVPNHFGQTTGTYSNFKNYGMAIKVDGARTNRVSISHTNFQDNGISINLENSLNPYITSCHFQNDGGSQSVHCGIMLHHCNQYTVENNYFEGNVGLGVHIIGNTKDNNKIKNNTFQNLCVGCFVAGINGETVNKPNAEGLQFLCNNYIDNAEDIQIANGASIRYHQGFASYQINGIKVLGTAAGNCFSGNKHINNLSGYEYHYHYYISPADVCQSSGGHREPDDVIPNNLVPHWETKDYCSNWYGYIGAAYDDMNDMLDMPYYEDLYTRLIGEFTVTRGNEQSGGGRNILPDSNTLLTRRQ